MKIGLGTVQFGVDYGISNAAGKVMAEDVQDILSYAATRGIDILDTAHTYGYSEEAIGNSGMSSQFRIVTKTPLFKDASVSAEDVKRLEREFSQSLKKLKRPSIYGLLVHHAEDILRPNGERLIEKMSALVESGKVEKIGVSLYSTDDMESVLDIFVPDIIQLPLNVFDQDKLSDGTLQKLKDMGVEVHIRSVFLQGLLLMRAEQLPPFFAPIRPHLEKYHAFLSKHGLSLLQGALKFVLQAPVIDHVILGVCTRKQLEEIVLAESSMPVSYLDMSEFALTDENYINPSKWKV